jgi:hypothetical protein
LKTAWIVNLNPPALNQSREMFEGPVIGGFRVFGKTAAGKLTAFQMIA